MSLASIGYREKADLKHEPQDTDVYVLRKKRWVSVSPLSLDLSSRVDLTLLDQLMEKNHETKKTAVEHCDRLCLFEKNVN